MYGNGHIESGIAKNFYRIGEVSRLTDTKPFVLRYWETEFPMLQPVKSPKGHRLYRREDVDTVLRIKRLLYDEGFTIAGARRHLREEGDAPSTAPHTTDEAQAVPESSADRSAADLSANGGAENGSTAEGGPATEASQLSADRPAAEHGMAAERRPEAPATIGRKVLLDLRDSLRAFLTLLENE
jgi:DNA-binding transcriptional MerR regulator